MKKFAVKSLSTLVAAMIAVSGMAVPGMAGGRQACDAYARHVANHRANGGNVLMGTLLGIGAGALVGSIVGGHHAVQNGMILGGVGGTVAGGISTSDKWHRVYQRAYAECRAN